MRRSYGSKGLSEGDLASTWLEQLERWISDAERSEAAEPNAMVLATADGDGVPGVRTVLLRGLDGRGLAFYTNLRSRKGSELAENPRASAVLLWLEIHRQVRVDGTVEAVAADEADAYFASRPYGSRVSSVASPQSQVIESREQLERSHEEVARASPEDDPPARPESWGGRRIVPESVEFWQGRRDRLHDRLRYRREESGAWVVERLAP